MQIRTKVKESGHSPSESRMISRFHEVIYHTLLIYASARCVVYLCAFVDANEKFVL